MDISLRYYPYRCLNWDEKIGQGGNGDVYKVFIDKKMYASKVYSSSEWEDVNDFYGEIEKESNILDLMNESRHSIHTLGYSSFKVSEDNLQIIFIFDIYKIDLYDYIQKDNFWKSYEEKPETLFCVYNPDECVYYDYLMDESQKIKITMSLLEGVEELHSNNIIHGDIKTCNLMYNNNKIIIIDFNASEIIEEGKKSISIESSVGTEGYCAAEQIENNILCYKSDVYSVGVSLIELWCGDIWSGVDGFRLRRNEVLYSLRKIEKKYPEWGKVLRKSIDKSYKKRISLDKLKQQFMNLFN